MQLVDVVPETPVHTATRFRPAGMFALVLAVAAASITYRLAGVNWFGSPLSLKSHLGFSVMLAFVVVGVYQFYFWIQQNDHFARRRSLRIRSEEHTSELQSPCNLVCRLLLEKKNKTTIRHSI